MPDPSDTEPFGHLVVDHTDDEPDAVADAALASPSATSTAAAAKPVGKPVAKPEATVEGAADDDRPTNEAGESLNKDGSVSKTQPIEAADDDRPTNDDGESLNKDGSVSKNQPKAAELTPLEQVLASAPPVVNPPHVPHKDVTGAKAGGPPEPTFTHGGSTSKAAVDQREGIVTKLRRSIWG